MGSAEIKQNQTNRKGRGGSRPGAGRKRGIPAPATKEQKDGIEGRARLYTEEALKALVAIAKKGASESARVTAACALLDRGYGRPRQSVEHSGPDGGPIEVKDAELRDKLAGRIAGLASRLTPVVPAVIMARNGNGNGNGHHE